MPTHLHESTRRFKSMQGLPHCLSQKWSLHYEFWISCCTSKRAMVHFVFDMPIKLPFFPAQ
jgi:hypothetical protein